MSLSDYRQKGISAWKQSREVLGRISPWFPWLLLIFAFVYYGQYYRSGLNLSGEGGTTAVLAMRLMEGQRPIVDTFLGYNLLWFYPVVGLFEWLGPNYIALRIYFFALCTVGGLLGYFTVLHVTKRPVLALATGVSLILIPGMMFRNYMIFLGTLNLFTFLHAFVLPCATHFKKYIWVVLSAISLTLTYLVRIDIALFLTPVWAGLAFSQVIDSPRGLLKRLLLWLATLAIGVGVFTVFHYPFFFDAHRRGFGESLRGQYTSIFSYIHYECEQKIFPYFAFKKPKEAVPPASQEGGSLSLNGTDDAGKQEISSQPNEGAPPSSGTRPRPSLKEVLKSRSLYSAAFPLIIHFPVLMLGLLGALGVGGFLGSIFRKDSQMRKEALVLCAGVGVSLGFFPQYYFFRPDTPHLSEFMATFLVVLACAIGIFYGRFVAAENRMLRRIFLLLIALCFCNAGLYIYHSFPKESAGTIAAKNRRDVEFTGQNHVRVWLRPLEATAMQKLHNVIMDYSAPNDWVICYPYAPMVNFMTDRPSYAYNLYIDNATASAHFDKEAIAQIQEFRPAVIVVDNREVNAHPQSRFKVWAKPTYDFIREHYQHIGTFQRNEVYVRRTEASGSEK